MARNVNTAPDEDFVRLLGLDASGELVAKSVADLVSSPTPTITCGTPGDLSVGYTTQVLDICDINGASNLVVIALRMQFIPTFTTASGQLRIVGFPFTFVGGQGVIGFGNSATMPVYPAGISRLLLHCAAGQNFAVIRTQGSGAGGSMAITDFVSGSSYIIDASAIASI